MLDWECDCVCVCVCVCVVGVCVRCGSVDRPLCGDSPYSPCTPSPLSLVACSTRPTSQGRRTGTSLLVTERRTFALSGRPCGRPRSR